MDTANLVNQIVDAQVAAKAAAEAQKRAAGVTATPFMDKSIAAAYASQFPFMAPVLDSPQKLMDLIDGEAYKTSKASNVKDAPTGYKMQLAKQALAEIYGINAYTPKGAVNTNIPTD